MPKSLLPGGLWSATPTPLTADHRLDAGSVRRLVDRHVARQVAGLFLAGTCGEGAWLRERDKEALLRTAVEAAAGRLHIAIQVTDNSVARTLDNIDRAVAGGAGLAITAEPGVFMNFSSARLLAHFQQVVRRSPLPLGLYDSGPAARYALNETDLAELLAEPNLVLVKDSSSNPARRAVFLAARRARPELRLFAGNEFKCAEFLSAGYDGLMLGGAIFNAPLAQEIIAAVRRGDLAAAEPLQRRMTDLMYRVYGGPGIECWMAGLKELLVQLGVFTSPASLLPYPLSDACRDQIHAAVHGTDGLGFRPILIQP